MLQNPVFSSCFVECEVRDSCFAALLWVHGATCAGAWRRLGGGTFVTSGAEMEKEHAGRDAESLTLPSQVLQYDDVCKLDFGVQVGLWSGMRLLDVVMLNPVCQVAELLTVLSRWPSTKSAPA